MYLEVLISGAYNDLADLAGDPATSVSSEWGVAPAAGSFGTEAKVEGPERVPSLAAQLGMMGSISERAPQKYLIQNQTGLRLFYWTDRVRSQFFVHCKLVVCVAASKELYLACVCCVSLLTCFAVGLHFARRIGW